MGQAFIGSKVTLLFKNQISTKKLKRMQNLPQIATDKPKKFYHRLLGLTRLWKLMGVQPAQDMYNYK